MKPDQNRMKLYKTFGERLPRSSKLQRRLCAAGPAAIFSCLARMHWGCW